MLGELIGKFISPTMPMDVKLTLEFTIFYPIETHVEGFRLALFHGEIDNAVNSAVVNLEGSGWLGLVYISEDGTDNGLLFVIKKESPSSDLVAEDITIIMME